MKKIIAVIVGILVGIQSIWIFPGEKCVCAEELPGSQENQQEQEAEPEEMSKSVEVAAPSAILMEASNGQVIYEKSADQKLAPASVTKVMTLLLIFDALEEGKIRLEDSVTVSEYAASMGGSQVFLEPGETQTVDTMIKCIAVASANDACVAMAEHLCGSEEAFVSQMNQRAKELGMKNTSFLNCNGLDADGHKTTAKDIALMSRELITKYPKIHEYSMIWMENITHVTEKGETEFGLANTNKLVRQYEYTTGLKTGSTGQAKFCISATAEKDGVELIAVIMAAPDPKQRFRDATTLLNYGFGICRRYQEEKVRPVGEAKVIRGVKKTAKAKQKEPFAYVDTKGLDLTGMKRKVVWNKKIQAPIRKGQVLGMSVYYLNGEKVGNVEIVATEAVGEITYKTAAKEAARSFLL
ncbi:MAG: D-alanyl-D-alanine carboxypeptidase [Lachnospiraceae bacterium]|uniref:serine-type D-Ala-D-Ala carboxypeptidase n=1 Tax=Dorea phocaeensis TaxID=2040291 RepID=A0A850HGR0_9FIRM|nr:D-alanyl-D-alanine carboxypeptidase family protein [Dorea phocaeensis]MBS5131687.1 D-alanyl-D-alanine carboxypeptidase [Lachnospiraceae bacterium]NSK13582.1 D-alanyl-D-alanine carboxypeptidase [Dorea phocaeensis]NVH57289.1 D-alanyl-D-alanine carboxypeptidase [Dorea phocaeensis]